MTNSDGGGTEGVRLTLSTKTVGGYTDVPCASHVELVDWSPGGSTKSWGLARNHTYTEGTPFVWASISGDNSSSWCAAGAGNYCLSVARYDMGSEAVDYHEHPSWLSTTAPQTVDVVADDPDVVVLEKYADTVEQFEADSTAAAVTHTGADEPSQIEWATDNLFVVTNAGSMLTAQQCEDEEAVSDGTVWLSQLNATSPLVEDALSGVAKPEGVDVAVARRFNAATCDDAWQSGWHHRVAYVADFCKSVVYVYAIRRQAPSGEEMVLVNTVDLDSDSSSDPSAFSGSCHPSAVVYHPAQKNVYVLCQERGTIMRLNAPSDQCDPTWDRDDDEERLRYYNANADCSSTPTRNDCGPGCQPHDFAYRTAAHPGYLFANLSGMGQVIAIKLSDLTEQFLVYRDASVFQPQELELVTSDPEP